MTKINVVLKKDVFKVETTSKKTTKNNTVYKSENKETIWMSGAFAPDIIDAVGKDNHTFNNMGGNNAGGCGKCVLVKGEKWIPGTSAMVMKLDDGDLGELHHQIDMGVPGFDDDSYSKNIQNCPAKMTDDPGRNKCPKGPQRGPDDTGTGGGKYSDYNITRWETSRGGKKCSNIKNPDMKRACELYQNITQNSFSGKDPGHYKVVKCPPKMYELYGKSFTDGKQSSKDQAAIRKSVLGTSQLDNSV